MKLTTIALLITSLFMGVPVAIAADTPSASVSVEKFDPPAKLDDDNVIFEVVTVTKIPDTPNLVLHILCIRSTACDTNTFGCIGRVVSPGVVEGCRAVTIPSGHFAGDLVEEDGTIHPPPRPE
jgi:hypothetical protein